MIKEQDLLDAIEECQGERNPNANTCIKLAAYYTLLNNMYPEEPMMYSRSEPPNQVGYDSGSELSEMIRGLQPDEVFGIMDELMETVGVLVPKLYRATLKKLSDLKR